MKQNRFNIIKQLGQGSFSTIYSAFDTLRNEKVALKIEKPDKSKKVLIFEYEVLKNLQDLPSVCRIHDFIQSKKDNNPSFIVMQILGKNLAKLKKSLGKNFTSVIGLKLLIQILDAIELLHKKGYIHRDIKPSNFVVGKGNDKSTVYMVDFGLAKLHLNKNGVPFMQRKNTDFRGTITYASINAHNKIDLSRRDDLWSFYFFLLDFLNETLPWRNYSQKDDVKDIKARCFNDPETHLWRTTTKNCYQVKAIFYHLQSLKYEDTPDYHQIRVFLKDLLKEEEQKVIIEHDLTNIKTFTVLNNPENMNILKKRRFYERSEDDVVQFQVAQKQYPYGNFQPPEIEQLASDKVKIEQNTMFPPQYPPADSQFPFAPLPSAKADVIFNTPQSPLPTNTAGMFYPHSQNNPPSQIFQKAQNTPSYYYYQQQPQLQQPQQQQQQPQQMNVFQSPSGYNSMIPLQNYGQQQQQQQQAYTTLFPGILGENEDYGEFERRDQRIDTFNGQLDSHLFDLDFPPIAKDIIDTQQLASRVIHEDPLIKFRCAAENIKEPLSEESLKSCTSMESFPFSFSSQNNTLNRGYSHYQKQPQSNKPYSLFREPQNPNRRVSGETLSIFNQPEQYLANQDTIKPSISSSAYYPQNPSNVPSSFNYMLNNSVRMNPPTNDILPLFPTSFMSIGNLNQLNNAYIVNNNNINLPSSTSTIAPQGVNNMFAYQNNNEMSYKKQPSHQQQQQECEVQASLPSIILQYGDRAESLKRANNNYRKAMKAMMENRTLDEYQCNFDMKEVEKYENLISRMKDIFQVEINEKYYEEIYKDDRD